MNLGKALLVLTSVAACGAGLAADARKPEEFGFKGVKRLEILFVNVGQKGVIGGVAGAPAKPTSPADDLDNVDLAKEADCAAIGTTLSHAGLEIVEKCKADDLTCAQLFVTVQNESIDRLTDRLYLLGLELGQKLTLARDKKVELSTPSTWATHRISAVPADHSAKAAVCSDLRGLATWFGSAWKMGNR
jgi:hypothetical protein